MEEICQIEIIAADYILELRNEFQKIRQIHEFDEELQARSFVQILEIFRREYPNIPEITAGKFLFSKDIQFYVSENLNSNIL